MGSLKAKKPPESTVRETFDLWSLDLGITLGTFPNLAAALAVVRKLCLEDLPELVLSRDDGINRGAIAVGSEVLNLAAVPGGPWSEKHFASVRREQALAAVRAASTAFVRRGDPINRRRLELASRWLARLGPPA